MVAATNAALAQGLITLDAPSAKDRVMVQNHQVATTVFRFKFPRDVKGIGAVREIGWGEVGIHAALFPTDDAERWITSRNANFFAGEAFASGWLERRYGPFLQSSPSVFSCRVGLKDEIARAEIEPAGYRDHGKVRI